MSKLVFTDETYDRLKFWAQILLPAAGAAYFGLAQVWNLPWGEQVVGTITVLDTFLGAILKVSSKNYEAGLEDKEEQ